MSGLVSDPSIERLAMALFEEEGLAHLPVDVVDVTFAAYLRTAWKAAPHATKVVFRRRATKLFAVEVALAARSPLSLSSRRA